MNKLTGKPMLLKQANLSLIRRAIKRKGTATRAEIAAMTDISSTTVRSLLTEMIENGEVEGIGHDASSGGRKAGRYGLVPDRYHGAGFCIIGNQVHSLLTDLCGKIVETTVLEVPDGNFLAAISARIDVLLLQKEIKSIGIGVPGIVEGSSYWRQDPQTGEMSRMDIGGPLSAKFGIPVVLENDLNATAIGFARCYCKKYPLENPEDVNMAYLHFEKDCISAGFISGGRILRGYNNFAGEIGLIPLDQGCILDDCMTKPMNDVQYTDFIVKILCWICGILNPRFISLGGPCLRSDCIGPIGDSLASLLPKRMSTELVYSPDVSHDYHNGIAFLTAGKMFDEVSLVRE